MKKFIKGCLITVFCMIMVGILLCLISVFMGGGKQISEMTMRGELSFGPEDFNLIKTYDIDEKDIFNDGYTIFSGRLDKKLITDDEVRSVEIGMAGGVIYLLPSEDDGFYVSAKQAGKFQAYVEEGRIYIKAFQENWSVGELYFYIPEGTRLSEWDISLGGGEVDGHTAELTGDKVSVKVGAGSIRLKRMEADEGEIKVGAGEVVIQECDIQDLSTKTGAGRLKINGSITGDLNADCTMGEMEFGLDGTADAHNYELKCAGGNIAIGDREYAGLAIRDRIDNDADSDFDLNCAMGNLVVTFEE